MHQRLVFGPPDGAAVFLDDIVVSVGASERPLTGGYQIVQHMEVGPLIAVGSGHPVRDNEWKFVDPRDTDIECSSSTACKDILALQRQFESEHRSPARARANRSSDRWPQAAGRNLLRPGTRSGRFFATGSSRSTAAHAAAVRALSELADVSGTQWGSRDLDGVTLPVDNDHMTALLGTAEGLGYRHDTPSNAPKG
jgi:hypothetical protein